MVEGQYAGSMWEGSNVAINYNMALVWHLNPEVASPLSASFLRKTGHSAVEADLGFSLA